VETVAEGVAHVPHAWEEEARMPPHPVQKGMMEGGEVERRGGCSRLKHA
jgi:hypothetical protein